MQKETPFISDRSYALSKDKKTGKRKMDGTATIIFRAPVGKIKEAVDDCIREFEKEYPNNLQKKPKIVVEVKLIWPFTEIS